MDLRRVTPFVVFVACAAAQARWRIPEHGVLRYAIEGKTVAELAEGGARNLAGTVPTWCHPLLFADECREGTHWLAEPWSLPSIPVWFAFDLRTWNAPGPIDRSWPRIDQHGVVRARGRASVIDGYGWQTLTVRLTREELQPLPGQGAEWLRLDRHYLPQGLDAEMIVRRHFDAQRGVVDEVVWSLQGRVGVTVGQPLAKLDAQWKWRLAEVLEPRFASSGDGSFAQCVHDVSARTASQQLRLLMQKDTPWVRDTSIAADLPAAMLFGLARAGRRAGDPGIADACRAVVAHDLRTPHGFAFAMLAQAELHAERTGNARWPQGAPRLPVPASERAQLEAWLQRLQGLAVWSSSAHGAAVHWCLAGTQQEWPIETSTAIQALDAAARAGCDVPVRWFEGAARRLLQRAVECEPGRAVMLRGEGFALRGPAAGSAARIGWVHDYEDVAWQCTGDATAGSMAALLCCRRHVRDAQLLAEIDRAVAGGWSWLADHWTGRYVPATLHVHRQWFAEFTLALAWLLDESGVRWLGERDVAFEHAMVRLEEFRGAGGATVVDPAAALVLWSSAVDAAAPAQAR